MLWSAALMPFSEIIGQDRALGALRSALSRGALHHAYLFAGPPGVGKGTAARLLAQAANCEAPIGDGGAAKDASPPYPRSLRARLIRLPLRSPPMRAAGAFHAARSRAGRTPT